MSSIIKNCNFSCTCFRDDCERKHYIENIKDRKIIKDLFDANYDKSIHNETDPEEIRIVPCFFGPLCEKSECNYKHYCSYEFRKDVMIKEWHKILHNKNKEELLNVLVANLILSLEIIEKLTNKSDLEFL